MHWETMPILVILVLSVIGHNQSVSVAAAVLLLLKLLKMDSLFPYLESYGLLAGITILTIAVLVPLAAGRITLTDMAGTLKHPLGLAAIAAGLLAAWLAGRGMVFIKDTPETVTALVIGTIAGVCFLKGLAIGPLIAGGFVSLILALVGIK
ncbi:hypothetical protein SDC9_96227 [bioreactor metagenome]|uniref:Uncharacterized protein n=1 Tax=bioreactor metagenome TaxID=1076179 RepID=A0A645A8W1_9ZZZZ